MGWPSSASICRMWFLIFLSEKVGSYTQPAISGSWPWPELCTFAAAQFVWDSIPSQFLVYPR
jgi:hypothetical protein